MKIDFFLEKEIPTFLCVFLFLFASGCTTHTEEEKGMKPQKVLVLDESLLDDPVIVTVLLYT